MQSLKYIIAAATIALPSYGFADGAEVTGCSSLDRPVAARNCLLQQRLNGNHLLDIQKGAASSAVMDAEVALRVREQMTEMTGEREAMALGEGGSGSGLALLAPLLVLLVVLGAGSSGNGDTVSPS